MSDNHSASSPTPRQRPLTIYLDTSDLSYLVRDRGPGGVSVAQTRARLVALLATERARLVVSFVHLAEMALHDATAEGALRWLEMGPQVWCFTTSPEAIFRAELLRTAVTIDAEPLTRSRIEAMRLPLRGPLPTVSGTVVARGVRWVAEGLARAEKLSKRASARRMPAKEHAETVRERDRIVQRVLRGEHSHLPLLARVAAGVLMPIARWGVGRQGLTLDDVQAHRELPPGCSWFGGSIPPGAWRDAAKRVRTCPRDAPASALRIPIDAGRPTQPSAVYDVRHLAYAAHCDFATIDGPNFRATASVRAQLATTFFRTGQLEELIEVVERVTAEAQ